VGHDYPARLARASDACAGAGIAGLVVTPSADLVYLVGYDAVLLERLTALVVPANADAVLIVPELERPRATTTPAGELVSIETWPDGGDPYELVRRILAGTGAGETGEVAVSDHMFAAHLLNLQRALPGPGFIPGSTVLSDLRARKEPGEIELLRRAARSADETFGKVTALGLSGKRELDVAASLDQSLVATGHDQALFHIVGSGPNAASPHHDSGDRRIQAGEMVVMDFGGRLEGYCSDVTRTVSVGEPDAEAMEVHAIVREAQEAAFAAVRPGVPGEEVDRVARRVITQAGYGDAFIHRTGHGIGLDEHEDPYIVEGNEEPLEQGMCFSIEPGVYLQGRFGVRIEDIVTVTEDGAESLNNAPRELLVVE
jgi:Xaa-Pro aminopeptidase